jgi:hypothetical protein
VARINKFYRGSATFKCNVCGRGTRDTGAQSVGNKICPQCYELAGIENSISDGYATREEQRAEIDRFIAEILAKGGDVADWRHLQEAGDREITPRFVYSFNEPGATKDEPVRVESAVYTDWAARGVGAQVVTFAAAPGCGQRVYRITRVTADAVFGVVVSDTVRELRIEEVR